MEIKIPAVGESVFEALVAKWLKKDGELVKKDEPLCEIETDKITLEINAEAAGVLSIGVKAGETVKIGTVIGAIDEQGMPEGAVAPGVEPVVKPESQPVTPQPPLSPAVRKMAQEKGLKPETIQGSGKGGRITVDDLLKAGIGDLGTGIGDRERPPKAGSLVEQPSLFAPAAEPLPAQVGEGGRITRKPMTPIRKRIAERLLAARQQTAMLTTFNEADMSAVIALRTRYKEHFQKRHGIGLGLMSFFVKASVEALKEFPLVNARIDGDDIVYQHFYDIGIAVSGEKGLVVPVLRDADRLHLAEIEKRIDDFVEKVKGNRLAIADLEGGTFTITNGGVFGSLLSTPILNPPQSGVLGMHAIQERPVALDGKVVIRPMMYLALSYDHRIIDGREAVGFLKKIKECIEDPEEMLLEG